MLKSSKVKYIPSVDFRVTAAFDWDDQPVDVRIPEVKISTADVEFNALMDAMVVVTWSPETAAKMKELVQSVQRDVENTLGESGQEAPKNKSPRITMDS
jgi:hypothetical protein